MGNKVLKKTAVLLYPQFSEYELTVALSILMQGQKPVITASADTAPIVGESGLTCLPDTVIDELDLDDIDSLLLPGCMDIQAVKDHDVYVDLIKRAEERDYVIASISSSPLLLAKAGILSGRKYTAGLYRDFMQESRLFDLQNYSEEVVVQEGKIITARGRGFIDFGIALGKALKLNFDEKWYKTE